MMGVMLIVSSFIMMLHPGSTFALVFDVAGDDSYRLQVDPSGESFFDIKNMNPGDTEEGTFILKNDGTQPFHLWMEMEKVDSTCEPDLYDQLQMWVTYRNVQYYFKSMSEFSGMYLGEFPAEANRDLRFVVHLDGPGAGNEFQGCSLTVRIVFKARWDLISVDSVTLTVEKRIIDEDGVDISFLSPHNEEFFTVTVNGEPFTISTTSPAVLTGLPSGDYTVVEELPLQDNYSYVSGNDTVNIASGSRTVIITNKYVEPVEDKVNLIIRKKITDADGNDISNTSPHNSESFIVTVNDIPYTLSVLSPIDIRGLEPGTYTVREQLPLQQEEYIYISGNDTVTISSGTATVIIANEYLVQEIEVPPEPPGTPDLPKTGGVDQLLLLLGLILVCLGHLLRRNSVAMKN
jgi:hypothetical protein